MLSSFVRRRARKTQESNYCCESANLYHTAYNVFDVCDNDEHVYYWYILWSRFNIGRATKLKRIIYWMY